jgi:hypothetical protein
MKRLHVQSKGEATVRLDDIAKTDPAIVESLPNGKGNNSEQIATGSLELYEQGVKHFVSSLFPNLTEADHKWLEVCRTYRDGLGMLLSSGPNTPFFNKPEEYEMLATCYEMGFVELIKCIRESAFMETLTPEQLVIVEREFLTVDFTGR